MLLSLSLFLILAQKVPPTAVHTVFDILKDLSKELNDPDAEPLTYGTPSVCSPSVFLTIAYANIA